MPVSHSALTGANLHEPKGADAAAVDTVPVSDGAGGTSWRKVASDEVTSADAGGYYTGTDVEAQLQELGPTAAALDAKFGEMYIAGNSTATTVTVAATYYQVTAGWTQGTLDDVTFSTDHLVVPADGNYYIMCSFSFEGATGDTFKFDFHKDVGAGYVPIGKGDIRRKTPNTDVGACAHHTIVALTAGDKIAIFGQNEGATSNFTITDATFSIFRASA